MAHILPGSDDQPEGAPEPRYAHGGLITGPDGADVVPVLIDLRYEQVFTAVQVRRFIAAKPGSRDALRGDGDSTDPT